MTAKTSDELLMTIADNGSGFSPSVVNGIGRELIISLCKNEFRSVPHFYNEQGAVIEISIPRT
jgi:two-component sensor histidine kinase